MYDARDIIREVGLSAWCERVICGSFNHREVRLWLHLLAISPMANRVKADVQINTGYWMKAFAKGINLSCVTVEQRQP